MTREGDFGSHLLQHLHYKTEETDLESDLPEVTQQTCNRARVELNHPPLSPELSASSQPTVLSLS